VSASQAPKPLLKQLGKHTVSGSCLHIKRLSDVDLDALGRLVTDSVKRAKKRSVAG
jgi:hypothetical protein